MASEKITALVEQVKELTWFVRIVVELGCGGRTLAAASSSALNMTQEYDPPSHSVYLMEDI